MGDKKMSLKTDDFLKRRLKEELRNSIVFCEEHGGWIIDENEASIFIDTYERWDSYFGYTKDARDLLIAEGIKKARLCKGSFIGLV